jgi:hypothetical protein
METDYGRKWSWHNLRYYPGICLEGLRKTTRNLVQISHVGGVVVTVLATGPKGCGFKPGQGDGFLRAMKNPQHTFLSDGK